MEQNTETCADFARMQAAKASLAAQKREDLLLLAQMRKKKQVEHKRREKVFLTQKWGILREKRLEMIEEVAERRAQRIVQTAWLKEILANQIIRFVFMAYNDKRKEIDLKKKINNHVCVIARAWRRMMDKIKGPVEKRRRMTDYYAKHTFNIVSLFL